MIFILIILIAILIVLIVYVTLIKYQIREILHQVKRVNRDDINRITIPLINKDIIDVTSEMNKMIMKNEKLNLNIKRKDENLKKTIANLSHDFRTPLTSIIGYIQLIDKSDLNKKQLLYIDIINKKSYELRGLADMFFQLSILELDEMKIDLKRENIGNLLTNIVIENIDLIEKSNFLIDVDISSKAMYAYVDRVLLNRIVQNLISNSLKYGLNKLYIGLFECNGNIEIIFKNNIEKLDIDVNRIFDEFYSNGKLGTGLGLSIVKTFVEKMNGEINASKDKNNLIINIIFESRDKK